MNEFGVVLFHTTSSAIRAEKILKEDGFTVKLVPTPRQLSSDCGVALRFQWEQEERVKELLEEEKVEVAQLHRL